jgi:replicative DNA helicase
MADAIDHGRTVLGAILAGRPDLLATAQRHLKPEHFTDSVQAALFTMCERYADQSGGVLPRAALADILRSAAPGTVLKYEEYFDLLTVSKPSDEEFRWSVQQLRELYAERRTGEVITRSMEVLTRGITEGTGQRQRELRGHNDARSFILSGVAGIERELSAEDAPEGDMRAEGREIKEDYVRREMQRATGSAVSTGIAALDAMLGGGYQRGELGLVAGYTSAGKSKWCAQTAWHAVTQQRRNVVIFTSETLRSQVRFSILSRHSRLDQFGIEDGQHRGINTRDMKAGTLRDKNAFAAVLHDFVSNAAHGHCYIAQVPRGATVATLESRLARLARDWTADLVIIDYLALLHAETQRRELRESLVEIIKSGKELAVTYQDGLGVPVLSPWQMSRAARDEASKSGGYTLSSPSETAEASNTPDGVLGLLEPDSDDSRGRAVRMKLSVLKNRDGERGGEPLEMTADYATSFFAPSGPGNSHEGLMDYEGEF